jgi:pimeloyl-ACP methyl ester carboxylesterase
MEAMEHETSRFVVRDVGVNVRHAGAGERVLFLHGAADVLEWLPFFDLLAPQCELLAPDHPGFGDSDDPPWIHHVADLAMFYLDFLEDMNWPGVHLVGHALGGWLAAEIAIRNATRLRSLTLIAPEGIRLKGVPRGDVFIWSPEERATNLFWDPAHARRMIERPMLEGQSDRILRNRYAATKFLWQPRGFSPDLEKWLHRVKLPVSILWGDSDRVVPGAYARRWLERIPQARLEMIERCGHLPHVERPQECARAVLSLVAAGGASRP